VRRLCIAWCKAPTGHPFCMSNRFEGAWRSIAKTHSLTRNVQAEIRNHGLRRRTALRGHTCLIGDVGAGAMARGARSAKLVIGMTGKETQGCPSRLVERAYAYPVRLVSLTR
jgi:hypothetical protein